MKYFFCKLIPLRPNFVQTMTAEEGKLMQEHAAYWKGMMDQGRALHSVWSLIPKAPTVSAS